MFDYILKLFHKKSEVKHFPVITPVNNKQYKLVEPLVDVCGVTIPAGFKTDGASVPKIFWFFVGHNYDPTFLAYAIAHDWLYSQAKCKDDYRNADEWFYYALRESLPKIKAWLFWAAVRIYSFIKY